jgi:hypothetical protein
MPTLATVRLLRRPGSCGQRTHHKGSGAPGREDAQDGPSLQRTLRRAFARSHRRAGRREDRVGRGSSEGREERHPRRHQPQPAALVTRTAWFAPRRSRKSRWGGTSGYAFVSRRQLPDNCTPRSSPMRRFATRGYSVYQALIGTRTQRRQEMLLVDKNAIIYAKREQSA